MRRVAAAAGLLAGIACALTLLLQGIPDDVSVETTVTSTSSSSQRSGGCQKQCDRPETTVADVTVKSRTHGDPGAEGVLEKALGNDAGVTVIRLLLALITGMITAAAVLRLLATLHHEDDPDDGVAAESPEDSSHGGGGASQSPEKQNVVTWGKGSEPAEEADPGQREPRPAIARRKSKRFTI